MADDTGLNIQSNSTQRSQAVSSCVEKFIAQGMSPEDARARCVDSADKEMGTKELRRE